MSTMRSERGVALVTSLAILAVVGALVLGSILTTQVELAVSRNDATSAQAQYVAQAGLQTYKAALFQTFRRIESGGSSGSSTDACRNSLSGGIDFLRGGAGTTHAWVNNRIVVPQGQVRDALGNVIGTYNVTLLRDPTNENRITVESIGRTVVGGQSRQATATARGTFLIRNSSTLEQAVFVGAGSGMRFLNGNTTIYGGIYVIGDPNNRDREVFNARGNSGIFNHYDERVTSGTGDFLAAAARRSDNLCAAVRVQYGRIVLGGSVSLGTPANPLLSVAVGRGLADIGGAGPLECRPNKGVCTEAPVGPFDIADPPSFPRLDTSPATELCPHPRTWRTCIREEAAGHGLVLSTEGRNTVSILSPSGATLPADCARVLNEAAASVDERGRTRPDRALVFGSNDIDCTTRDSNNNVVGFRYTRGTGNNPATFEVFGNINLRGLDVRFDRAVRYTATSRSPAGITQQFANLSVEALGEWGGNFRTEASFITNAAQKFPNNVLSIVAERNVHLRGDFITAPIYAGDTFHLRTGSVLFGQVIADVFCTTSGGNDACGNAGKPADIVFVPTGENRARSFRAIAPTGGLPTFTVLSHELR